MKSKFSFAIFFILTSIIPAQPTFTDHTISTSADGAKSVYAADLDGDGDIDIVSASGIDDKIAWYENDGAQNFTEHVITDTANVATSVYAVDLDGDGDMDVLSGSYSGYNIIWYENDGSGSFTGHGVSGPGSVSRSVYAADLDGDEDMDVLSTYGRYIVWYENDGSQNFDFTYLSLNESSGYSVYAADVDGDGDMDVLSACDDNGNISDKLAWYENDGSGSFTEHTISSSTDGNRSVYSADVDGDGDMDVLTACWQADKIAWYENDGSESFTEYVISTSADHAYSVYATDVDGDGDMDVLSASEGDDKIAWYENDGSEAFTEHAISTSANTAYSVYATDVDGDGDMDVLSASGSDDKIAWYEQDGSPVFETTYVPDDNFEQALIDLGYDDVLDDYVLTENISGVTELNVEGGGISDLTGIEDFTAVTFLNCSNNELIALDVSNNTDLTSLDVRNNSLTNLDVSNNPALTYLDVGSTNSSVPFINQISTLDLNNNSELIYLSCTYNQLTTLDLSNNTTLRYLYSRNNQLTSLEVSNCTDLEILYCNNNQLNTIDISNNILINKLNVGGNNLTAVDVSNNTALLSLSLWSNQLNALDISNNTAITLLDCSYNQLNNLDVSNHTELVEFYPRNNQLTSLDVSNNIALERLHISNNQLTILDMRNGFIDGLTYFKATNNSLTCILVNEEDVEWATENWTSQDENIDEGVIFDPECLLAYTYVPDDNFEQALIDLGYDNALDDSVLTANIYIVTELNVSGMEISDLTGIEGFTALTELYCGYNQITSLNLSSNPELLRLDCEVNWLTSLNLKSRHPSEFESIYGVENPLECVDVLDPLWALDNWYDNFDRSVEFAFICGAEGRTAWHVSAGGSNNSGDGSQESPLATIQLAIDVSSNGDSVLVGSGIYNENISWFNKHLTIMGAGSGETIIDAQQLDNGVRIQNINNSSLFEGFTIKNGSTFSEDYPWSHGGGICLINSHATLRDIIVEDCVLQEQDWQNGNGIFVGGSNSLFEDVTVRNNEGGGIALSGSDSYPVLNRVLIEDNTNGFGMRVYDTGVIMDSSEVVNNPAGGIWYEGVGSNPSIYTHSLFHNNGSENSQFGAIQLMNSGGVADFSHCTFYGNQSGTLGSDIYSLGLYFNEEYSGNDITIVNSVFYNEQESSIYLQPTDYADTLNISYSSLLTMESITLDDVNHLEIGAGMIYGDPILCDAGNEEYTISIFSPLNGAGSDGETIGAFGVDCGNEPTITGVWDVPNDQGGRVYLDFNRCVYDQLDQLNQLYTVFRLDMIANEPVWVVAASGAAIGDQSYTYEILTLQDSTASGDGLTSFKVVASMNEGIFHSDEMAGYSVDNIAPGVPTGMQALAMENSILLSWNMSEAEDFQYFVLERSNEDTAGVEQSTISYELIDIIFEDIDLVRNVEYAYRLAAYDYAGNQSEFTQTVSTILLSVDQKRLFPEAYTLHQNYPNPFNPITQIRYDLPLSEYVSINIYDLMGKRIKSLVNTNQDAGYRSIYWNATNDYGQPVSAGMYIYTIQAGEFRQTRKMVLLK